MRVTLGGDVWEAVGVRVSRSEGRAVGSDGELMVFDDRVSVRSDRVRPSSDGADLRIVRDGAVVLERTGVDVEFERFAPNGPRCPPRCWVAVEELK